MHIRSFSLTFDGEPQLRVSQEDGKYYVFTLSDEQLWLLAKQSLAVLFYHYNIARPEGQSPEQYREDNGQFGVGA